MLVGICYLYLRLHYKSFFTAESAESAENLKKKLSALGAVSPHLRVIKQPIAESVAGWLKKAGRVVWAAASTAAGL